MLKSKRINLRISQELKNTLDKIAIIEGRSLSDVCCRFLEREAVNFQMRKVRRKLKGA